MESRAVASLLSRNPMLNPRTALDRLIADFLKEQMTLEDFQRRYSASYADDEADKDFLPAEVEYYGSIHERAEWTAKSPNLDDRKHGWRNEAELKAWLRALPPPPPGVGMPRQERES